jgi:muconolactone D-isomerase
MIQIEVKLPLSMPDDEVEELRARERDRAIELQKSGEFVHLWRVAGRPASFSVIEAKDHNDLHRILTSLPMFKYFELSVYPLADHPSALASTR